MKTDSTTTRIRIETRDRLAVAFPTLRTSAAVDLIVELATSEPAITDAIANAMAVKLQQARKTAVAAPTNDTTSKPQSEFEEIWWNWRPEDIMLWVNEGRYDNEQDRDRMIQRAKELGNGTLSLE